MRYPIAVLLLAAASTGCSKPGGAAGSGPPRAVLTVHAQPVEAKDVVYHIQAVGGLEAEEVVQVTAEVEGVVADVLFNEGMRVSPRTVLVRIDPERYRVEAQRAEATYKKGLADSRRAASENERRLELAKQDLVAAEELSRAHQESERLSAEADSAKADWEIALQNRARSEVTAPRGGVINTRTVDRGQYVQAGTVLTTIVDTSRLRLRFRVSEVESLRARVGQPITFRVAALGNVGFEGEVYHVGQVADPGTRQVEVLAWVKNPGVLKPGFFAEVVLASETKTNALVVPERAVQASDRGFVAYVVEDGKARLRPLELGVRTADGVEILGGLKAGDLVVVEGSDRLADGIDVRTGPPAGAGSGGAADGAAGAQR